MASGRLDIPYAQPAIDNSGDVVAGATLTFYDTGTTNLSSVFADPNLSTLVANPQAGIYASNAAGRFTTQTDTFWLDASIAYDVILGFPDGSSLDFFQQYVLGAATNVAGFAPINSPVFTGNPQAPTPATDDNSASIATTAFVDAQGFAPLNSPVFTGVPEAPTASPGTNTTQLATTAFVQAAAPILSVAKGWVTWAGTTGIVAAANNVTSVTRNAMGDYTINIPAGILADANYALSVSMGSNSTNFSLNSWSFGVVSKSQTALRLLMGSSTVAVTEDPVQASVIFFGN